MSQDVSNIRAGKVYPINFRAIHRKVFIMLFLAGMEKYHVSCGNLFWFSVKIEDSLTGSHIQ